RLTPLRLPALGGGGQRTHPVETTGSSLVTLTNAHSPGAEAYRSLRTNLLFSRAARRLQTLAITSSAPAEGKSTTCANLAIAFAAPRGQPRRPPAAVPPPRPPRRRAPAGPGRPGRRRPPAAPGPRPAGPGARRRAAPPGGRAGARGGGGRGGQGGRSGRDAPE